MFGFNMNIVTESKGVNMLVSFNPYTSNVNQQQRPSFKATIPKEDIIRYFKSFDLAEKFEARVSDKKLDTDDIKVLTDLIPDLVKKGAKSIVATINDIVANNSTL